MAGEWLTSCAPDPTQEWLGNARNSFAFTAARRDNHRDSSALSAKVQSVGRLPTTSRAHQASFLPGAGTRRCTAQKGRGTDAVVRGDLYATELNATDEAQWSSASPNVVRIVGPGVLRAVVPGDALITARFRGYQQETRFRVLADGPPWRLYTGEYHVQVRDANDAFLEGVNVEILAGGNAGMQAVSDRFGRAIFVGDSVCGPITVRGTKTGYRDWIGSAIKCGRGGNGNWGSETVGPLRMVPLP